MFSPVNRPRPSIASVVAATKPTCRRSLGADDADDRGDGDAEAQEVLADGERGPVVRDEGGGDDGGGAGQEGAAVGARPRCLPPWCRWATVVMASIVDVSRRSSMARLAHASAWAAGMRRSRMRFAMRLGLLVRQSGKLGETLRAGGPTPAARR